MMLVETEQAVAAPGTFRWGAIFGGTFTAIGLWILLGAFGLAVGLSAANPQDANLKGMGMWFGIWGLLVPIVSLFLGTLVATRIVGPLRPVIGVLYGVVVWAVTTLLGTVLAVSLIGSAVGQAVGLVKSTGSALAGAVGGAVPNVREAAGKVGEFLNVDRSDLVASVNRDRVAQGKQPVTPEQLQGAIQDAANTALRQGQMNEEILVSALARRTGLSQEESRQVAQRVKSQWDQTMGAVTSGLQRAGEQAQTVARTGLDYAGKGFWIVFGSYALSLLAAVLAGLLTVRRLQRRYEDERSAVRLEEAPAPA